MKFAVFSLLATLAAAPLHAEVPAAAKLPYPAIEVVTFDIATGIPLEYSNTGVLEVSVRFRVVDLALG